MTDKLKVIKDLIEKKEWEALEKYVDFWEAQASEMFSDKENIVIAVFLVLAAFMTGLFVGKFI